MSMLRKSAVTVAIAGAGLASLSGAAFANTSHHDSHGSHEKHSVDHSGGCTNNVKAFNGTEGGGPVDVLGGAQTIIPVNACDILNHNKVLNGNTITVGGTSTTIPTLPTLPTFP